MVSAILHYFAFRNSIVIRMSKNNEILTVIDTLPDCRDISTKSSINMISKKYLDNDLILTNSKPDCELFTNLENNYQSEVISIISYKEKIENEYFELLSEVENDLNFNLIEFTTDTLEKLFMNRYNTINENITFKQISPYMQAFLYMYHYLKSYYDGNYETMFIAIESPYR